MITVLSIPSNDDNSVVVWLITKFVTRFVCVLWSSFAPLFDPVAIQLVFKHGVKAVVTPAVWVSITQHVFSSWLKSKIKQCKVILSRLERNILRSI